MFVTERVGRVRVIVDGVVQSTPFLDITGITASGSERGLLSVAFAPDYATSGLFYMYMTATQAASQSDTTARSRSASSVARRRTRTSPIWRAAGCCSRSARQRAQPQRRAGPGRARRQAVAGHGRRRRLEQPVRARPEPDSRLGKLLRLDPVSRAVEQLAQGLRNPWRFSSRPRGEIVIADVGQGQYEEVNVGLAANYGWPC